MDNIIFNISAGLAPFSVELNTDPIRTMSVPDLGQYAFIDVPDGYYTITITDSLGCVEVLYVLIEGTTGIVYSANFIDHECEEEKVLLRRLLIYVGPSAPDLTTETAVTYEENVEIALNTPILPDINFFFVSLPADRTFTIYDILMSDVTSEFEYHSDQLHPDYVPNTIYRKRDIYDTTGSTIFYITIHNI